MIQWESQVENWAQKASARTPEARSEKHLSVEPAAAGLSPTGKTEQVSIL